jgi:N,N'-diacetyllegionaminate synthase
MLRRLELSPAFHREIFSYCEERKMLFLSTPFDLESVDLLERLGVAAYKISSGEVVNHPFLELIASKRRPIILSTGMAYLSEVDEAVRVMRKAGCAQLAMLHCVTNYPADPADANLRAIPTLEDVFDLPVGFSDHTSGIEVALAAVALGAHILEKHFTLDRGLPGPDHSASLEPGELAALVRGVRTVEAALGRRVKFPSLSEEENRLTIRRSLAAACAIPAGILLTPEYLIALRPAHGLSPQLAKYVVGRKLRRALKAGEFISLGDLE